MPKVIHKAATRGHANHGWLDTYHSFSFARYFNPERMNFGQLRVLNDDTVAGGAGFGSHPHDNMEIVSIPLAGTMEHRDTMGNVAVINAGDVQIMSAGTGVVHSEYNKSEHEELRFLQIWVQPKELDINPRYEQNTFHAADRRGRIQTVVAPNGEGAALRINQDAWFSLVNLQPNLELTYDLHRQANGVYLFLIEGEADAGNTPLHRRDGAGFWDSDHITLKASTEAEVLLIEVPMD